MILQKLLWMKDINKMNSQEYNSHLEKVADEAFWVLLERERNVLEQRYGYRGKPRMQKDIATEFGVSKTRIGQIENNALRKMRIPYQHIKTLQGFLPAALSYETDNFYSRLLIKLFRLKPEHISYILNQQKTNFLCLCCQHMTKCGEMCYNTI